MRRPSAAEPQEALEESDARSMENGQLRDEWPSAHDQDLPPPAYGQAYGQIDSEQDGIGTWAAVTDDGRVNIRIDQSSRRLSSLLVPALRQQVDVASKESLPLPPAYIPPSLGGVPGQVPPPSLNVVVHVVGSRGDVQPFVALGKVLKETYGHRVRLATHPVFKDFVEEHDLEFFAIGGDPSELMAFMVKNPGLMPGFDTLRKGDIGKRRKNIAEMIKGCWRSCIETGDGSGVEASDSTVGDFAGPESGSTLSDDPTSIPFIADAIIANPPSFAHIHCAEKLGIPLHMMFTMPWSPTQAFPHPLANIQSSNADASINNFLSYALVDMMTWQGLGDIINRFRQQSLGLEPISLMWAPGMLARLRVPWTYCWSPALIPKPRDWGYHISIAGFYFLSLASNFTPEAALAAFLDSGPRPVYIGFGSIVVDDPNALTKLIFEAVKKTGQRALVSKGWGGFGADQLDKPEGVFMLGNVPHDWLFERVSCVVHHGGAGTSAAGIAAGKPTVVVPFFGDQPFWGAMIAKAGAGPKPIPQKQLTADNLAEAIQEALMPQTLERAKLLSSKISQEKGSNMGAQSFHQFLEVDKLRCSLAPSRGAVWRVKRTDVRLSALAATVLVNEGLLGFQDLKLYRPREYASEVGPWDPITGGAGALIGTIGSVMMGVADLPIETLKALKIHPEASSQRPEPAASSSRMQGSLGIHPEPMASCQPSSTSARLDDAAVSGTALGLASNISNTNTAQHGEKDRHLTTPAVGSGCFSATTTPLDPESSLVPTANGRLDGPSAASGSQSQSGDLRSSSPFHLKSDPDRSGRFDLESAMHTGKGVSRMVGAGLKSPMDFTLALAQGFHNAPKLYGDNSVRQSEKITGLQSGLMAATKGFGYGFYDGITGLVTQPVTGAKKEGTAGFFKGIGKGIGGLVLKPGAAIWGIPGYTMKGIYKELQKYRGPGIENYIIAARTAQGYEDLEHSTPEERHDIGSRWRVLQKDLKKKKYLGEEQLEALQQRRISKGQPGEGVTAGTHESAERSRRPGNQPAAAASSYRTGSFSDLLTHRHHDGSEIAGPRPRMPLSAGVARESTHSAADYGPGSANDADDAILEDAIRQSIAQTSQGDAEEDELIERAVRASVAEFAARQGRSEDEDIRRAMEESLTGSSQGALASHEGAVGIPEAVDISTEPLRLEHEHDGDNHHSRGRRQHMTEFASHSSDADSGIDTDDDENIKAAIANSKMQQVGAGEAPPDDEDLRKAVAESQRIFEEEQGLGRRGKAEEEIVLEYVKKQSLMEEEYRQKLAKGKRTEEAMRGGNEGDEDLKRVIEESLRTGGKAGESSRAAGGDGG